MPGLSLPLSPQTCATATATSTGQPEAGVPIWPALPRVTSPRLGTPGCRRDTQHCQQGHDTGGRLQWPRARPGLPLSPPQPPLRLPEQGLRAALLPRAQCSPRAGGDAMVPSGLSSAELPGGSAAAPARPGAGTEGVPGRSPTVSCAASPSPVPPPQPQLGQCPWLARSLRRLRSCSGRSASSRCGSAVSTERDGGCSSPASPRQPPASLPRRPLLPGGGSRRGGGPPAATDR